MTQFQLTQLNWIVFFFNKNSFDDKSFLFLIPILSLGLNLYFFTSSNYSLYFNRYYESSFVMFSPSLAKFRRRFLNSFRGCKGHATALLKRPTTLQKILWCSSGHNLDLTFFLLVLSFLFLNMKIRDSVFWRYQHLSFIFRHGLGGVYCNHTANGSKRYGCRACTLSVQRAQSEQSAQIKSLGSFTSETWKNWNFWNFEIFLFPPEQ